MGEEPSICQLTCPAHKTITRLATPGHAQADRSLESLREELLEQGLLVKTPTVHFKDFLAAHSYAQRGQKAGDIDAEPSLLAIRNRLIELCVLPLVSALVRERCKTVPLGLCLTLTQTSAYSISQCRPRHLRQHLGLTNAMIGQRVSAGPRRCCCAGCPCPRQLCCLGHLVAARACWRMPLLMKRGRTSSTSARALQMANTPARLCL